MIVDVGRRARRSIFHFFAMPDRLPMPPAPAVPGAIGFFVATPRQTRVRWYYAPKGAKKLPMGTIFGSADFEDDFQRCEPQYGEQPFAPQTYYNGRPPQGAIGKMYCGTADDFLKAKKWSADLPTLQRGPTGLPLCCNPALRGAIAYTGAVLVGRSWEFFQGGWFGPPEPGPPAGWLGPAAAYLDLDYPWLAPLDLPPGQCDVEIYARGGFSSSYDWSTQLLSPTSIPGAGGGGTWCKKRITIVPGTTYLLRFVNDPRRGDYGDVSLTDDTGGIVYVLAKGGKGVTVSSSGGAGGLASGCIADIAFDGAAGGDSYQMNSDLQWVSGAGGSGANPGGTGGAAESGDATFLGGFFPLPAILTPPPKNWQTLGPPIAQIFAPTVSGPPDFWGANGFVFPNVYVSAPGGDVYYGTRSNPVTGDETAAGFSQETKYGGGTSYVWGNGFRPSWQTGVSTAPFTIPGIGGDVTVNLINTFIDLAGFQDWLFLDGDLVTITDGTNNIEGTISLLSPTYPFNVTSFLLTVTDDRGFAGNSMASSATILLGSWPTDADPATNGTQYGGGGLIRITPVR